MDVGCLPGMASHKGRIRHRQNAAHFRAGRRRCPGRRAARSRRSRDGCFVTLRRPIARGVAWVASAVVTVAAAQPADAQSKLEARYTASLAGVPLGRGVWVIDVAGDHYSSSASGKTVGLLQVFSSGQGSVAANGTVNGGKPVSAHLCRDGGDGKAVRQGPDRARLRHRQGVFGRAGLAPGPRSGAGRRRPSSRRRSIRCRPP